jgi:hypothetical protein
MAVNTVAARSAAKRSRTCRTLLAFAGAATLLLAGCDDGNQSRAKRATPFDLPAEQCLGMLGDRGISFEPLASIGDGNGCGIETPVSLSAMTAALSQPATLGCPLAVRFDEFERRILQPMAIRYFGQPVKRIHHYGAYACRNQIGGNAGQLSQHALGRAIDVAAFELVDGSMIRVKQDWHGIGRRSRFLRNVAREACDLFHVVLSPNHDRAHQDHLHFDTGPWRRCAA